MGGIWGELLAPEARSGSPHSEDRRAAAVRKTGLGAGEAKASPAPRRRCAWPGEDPLYLRYHDEEWGRPVADDRRLFEKIVLEGFQSGLSWLTILRKREAFRRAFAGFDFDAVAGFGARDVQRMLADAGIVRHRGKIESTVNNARRAVALRDEAGSLAAYFWSFEPEPGAGQAAAAALARDLKRRGWTFVGATTVYAFMQAMGMVNDHDRACFAWPEVERARRRFERPRGAP